MWQKGITRFLKVLNLKFFILRCVPKLMRSTICRCSVACQIYLNHRGKPLGKHCSAEGLGKMDPHYFEVLKPNYKDRKNSHSFSWSGYIFFETHKFTHKKKNDSKDVSILSKHSDPCSFLLLRFPHSKCGATWIKALDRGYCWWFRNPGRKTTWDVFSTRRK